MYMTRGTPGRKHVISGSAVSHCSAFSRRFSSAESWYGISPPWTTDFPAGAARVD